MSVLTLDQLEDVDACSDGITAFNTVFPEGKVEVTLENVTKFLSYGGDKTWFQSAVCFLNWLQSDENRSLFTYYNDEYNDETVAETAAIFVDNWDEYGI